MQGLPHRRSARERRRSWPNLALLAPFVCLTALTTAACRDRPAETPEDAYLLVLKACDKGDPAYLFDAFDTPTQWSIETVHHAQREMRQLVFETYPPEDKARFLGRIPDAAEEEEDHARRYYRRLDGSQALLGDLKKRIYAGSGQPVGSVDHRTKTATVWREGGSIFHFARDDKGRWGFSELRSEWDHAKLRAIHDLETVRKNAALYRQLAGGPPADGATRSTP
ncbi:MAG TPA: hypothetical protein VH877_30835 [Polyangia bacterium]|jgi:hypothetical protein|nr:hypothetical protein [Polyangia bacterium]